MTKIEFIYKGEPHYMSSIFESIFEIYDRDQLEEAWNTMGNGFSKSTLITERQFFLTAKTK